MSADRPLPYPQRTHNSHATPFTEQLLSIILWPPSFRQLHIMVAVAQDEVTLSSRPRSILKYITHDLPPTYTSLPINSNTKPQPSNMIFFKTTPTQAYTRRHSRHSSRHLVLHLDTFEHLLGFFLCLSYKPSNRGDPDPESVFSLLNLPSFVTNMHTFNQGIFEDAHEVANTKLPTVMTPGLESVPYPPSATTSATGMRGLN